MQQICAGNWDMSFITSIPTLGYTQQTCTTKENGKNKCDTENKAASLQSNI